MGDRDPFDLVGKVIDGRYRVDRVIGEGGFGVVYRGWHLNFEHDVAIKCLKTPSHFTDEGQRAFVEKFREEGKLLSRLSQHPAVVRVYDFGITPGAHGASVPYLVLEWLVGEPLDSWLAKRGAPLGAREAIELLRPAIEGLAFTHATGVAHRDVKPANLFVVQAGERTTTKVLDFADREGDARRRERDVPRDAHVERLLRVLADTPLPPRAPGARR